VTVPKKLSKKQKQLLEEYARATQEAPREEAFS
jgi:DnaJ-class molecular chaperone